MTSDMSSAERLYSAIKGTPGWYEALANAEDQFFGRDIRHEVGRLISSVLLAAGDDAEVIAVTGRLDDARSGTLVAVFPKLIVTVHTTKLGEPDSSSVTRVHSLKDVSRLVLKSGHSYYDGTDTYARSRNFSFTFDLAGETILLEPSRFYNGPSQVKDEAIYAAFVAIRDRAIAAA